MDLTLYNAAISGDINVLRQNIERVENEVTPNGSNVLHLASQSGKAECVLEILKMHPSLLGKPTSRGDTALHLAAREGHLHVAKTLVDEARKLFPTYLEEGVLARVNNENDTALHEAVRYNHLDIVRMIIIEDYPSLDFPNKACETPLYLAASRNHFDVVKAICETSTHSANYMGPNGRTVLHAAVIAGSIECVIYLLGNFKQLIRCKDIFGWTVFHYAAYYESSNMIKHLLEADRLAAYLRDSSTETTALHIAAGQGNIDVMKEVVTFCPDFCETVDSRGRNILHIAVERDHKDMVRYILQNCPIISNLLLQKDTDGNTPLHLLAISGCFVPELIQHKMSDKEALNNRSLTPLNILYSNDETVVEQVDVRKTLEASTSNRNWNLWSASRERGELKRMEELAKQEANEQERAKKIAKKIADKKSKADRAANTENLTDRIRKLGETHMVVAALIVTITFAAGLTLPGGFDGNVGPNQGMATLSRKTAFKVFMITDTIALVLSTTALVIYLIAAIFRKRQLIMKLYIPSMILGILAIVAMIIAFISGTYAVLAHSSALAIVVCVIGSTFFLIIFFIFYGYVVDVNGTLSAFLANTPQNSRST